MAFPNSESIFRKQLPNGITLLVYENFSSPSVVVEGLLRGGILAEPQQQGGLANMMASLLLRGTVKRPYAQIYDALESVGASLDFSCGYHTVGFSAQSLIEDVDLLLDLMACSLRQPTFPEEQVAQMRGRYLTRHQLQMDDTGYRAHRAFRELVYGAHPYGRSPSGSPESVAAISRDDVAAFHQNTVGPKRMIVTVVGAITAAEAEAKLTAVLGDWHNSTPDFSDDVPDPQPLAGLQKTAVFLPEKAQADIVLGLPGPRRSNSDFLDLSLANTVLGVFGMMGRIGQRVREEEGLAYYASSRLQASLGPTPWTAVAGTAPEDAARAVELMLAEVARMQETAVGAEELAECQSYRIGSLPVALETNAALADVIEDLEFYQLGLDYLQTYAQKMREIDAARVLAAAQRYWRLDEMAVVAAGQLKEL